LPAKNALIQLLALYSDLQRP